MKSESSTPHHPSWWTEHHASRWARVKLALRRDWEQTKADLSKKRGAQLHQDASDTVKQALGKAPLPPGDPSKMSYGARTEWDDREPAYRYGFGARMNYEKDFDSWDEGLETKLKAEWAELKTGRTWEDSRQFIREGWEAHSDEQMSAEPPHGGASPDSRH